MKENKARKKEHSPSLSVTLVLGRMDTHQQDTEDTGQESRKRRYGKTSLSSLLLCSPELQNGLNHFE